MKKRIAVLLLALVLCCSGCRLDVESFLQPPLAQKEQQAIQDALETYIRDSGQSGIRYTLQYPTEGEYTSAFVVCDDRGYPLENSADRASTALAFYELSATKEPHINLLRRQGEEWVSVGDTVGAGTDILQVSFGDLDGDGTAELLTGWSTYNSRDHHLTVFSMEDGLRMLSDDRVYTRLFVCSTEKEARDALLLLRIGDAHQVTAVLTALTDTGLTEVGRVRLDGYIQQFGAMELCQLDDSVYGVYVDAAKAGGTTVTELVCYDGNRLYAPFYDHAIGVTTVTARRSQLAFRDVDGDDLVEIPASHLLPGWQETAGTPSVAWLTVWKRWDYRKDSWAEVMHTVVNTTDQYMLSLDDDQRRDLTTRYDDNTHTLTLVDTVTDTGWLSVRPITEDALPEGYVLLSKATQTRTAYAVRYDESRLDIQKIRYMISFD